MEKQTKVLIVAVVFIMPMLSGIRAQRCHPTCQPPDCSCPRMSYPMPTRDIPQMVYFGFDDAVNIVMSSLYERIFTKNRKNPNGCRMKMSLYVSHQYTDYKKVKQFHDLGNEIGVHSVSHTVIDNDDLLRKEAKLQKENLARVGIPEEEILGWRSPFLKTAGLNQPQILKELGYEYDISLTYTRPSMTSDKPWPFTMDQGWPYICGVEPCPLRANVENFWSVPVVSLMDHKNKYACPYADGCAVPALTEKQSYDFLWNNFMSYYNTTRTPFGLNMHAAWFYRRHNLKAMMRFLDELMNYDDVYVVTVKQMIDWMKRPTPVRDIDTLQSWQCADSRNGARRQQRIAIPKPVKRQRPVNFLDLFRGPSPLKKGQREVPIGKQAQKIIRPIRKMHVSTLRTTTISSTKTITTKPTTSSTTRQATTTNSSPKILSTTTRPKTTKVPTTTNKIKESTPTEQTTLEQTTSKTSRAFRTSTTSSTITPTTRTTSHLTTNRPSTSTVMSTQTNSPSTTEDRSTRSQTESSTASSAEESSTSPRITSPEKTNRIETTFPPTSSIETSSKTTSEKTFLNKTKSKINDKLPLVTKFKDSDHLQSSIPNSNRATSQTISTTNQKQISSTHSDIPPVTSNTVLQASFGPPVSDNIAVASEPTNLDMGGLFQTMDTKFGMKDILTSSLIGGMSLIESITSLQDMFREAQPKPNQDFPHSHDHGHPHSHDRHHSHEAIDIPEINNSTKIKPPPPITNQPKSCIQGVNCHLPDCFCQGTIVPNNLKVEDTPQMVYITLEGSINPRIYRRYQKIFKRRMNPNNCRATGTVFATDSGSSSAAIKKLTLYGAEIAMQGLHEHHYDTIDHMEQEIVHQKMSLKQSNVNDVKGWKTPELKALGDDQYRLLKKYGFKYDATLLTTLPRGGGSNPWPFTLDFGYKGDCVIPKCPKQNFPGLWEVQTVPVLDYRNLYECSYVDGCMFNPPSANDTEDFLWKNFMFNYKSNKAPFGIHLRHLWFSHHAYKPNVLGFRRFLDRIQALKDVYIVSISDIIDWIQNPTPVKTITDKRPWKCS